MPKENRSAVARRRIQSGGGQNCGWLLPPPPSPLPEEREKHSAELLSYDPVWFSCASETKDKEAATATATCEFSSAVPTLSLSQRAQRERDGVRGDEANSNPRPTTIPGTVKFR